MPRDDWMWVRYFRRTFFVRFFVLQEIIPKKPKRNRSLVRLPHSRVKLSRASVKNRFNVRVPVRDARPHLERRRHRLRGETASARSDLMLK
jgi:hypothetical protein